MIKVISQDLRQRVVDDVAQGHPAQLAARRYNVGPNVAIKHVRRWCEEGHIHPPLQKAGSRNKQNRSSIIMSFARAFRQYPIRPCKSGQIFFETRLPMLLRIRFVILIVLKGRLIRLLEPAKTWTIIENVCYNSLYPNLTK